VNYRLGEIQAAMPEFGPGRGLLSFCFVDPFAANLKFNTLRALAKYRMDFLILLALGVDVRRNLRLYYEDPDNSRIADLIDCPGWRDELARTGENIVRFVARKFDEAMIAIGYSPATPDDFHEIRVKNKGVMQYLLVLYSRNRLGKKLWNDTLRRLNPQQSMDF
jgi:three-Cys-motif partner protein